ncbi:MAG TPA: ABC transporter ATP-binding protein [Pyrinomonadaceae bacterium]|nr:ABC transporter ATP-binding protein [Pyrinomonadaceae bacterium]
MTPIVKVENLSKVYQIGAKTAGYATLRESLTNALRSPFANLRRKNASTESIWALRDVSFTVMPGEAMGIIGQNGAGKSTLLKILSRITEPTTGRAELYGRAGSLLEVGTGFHPELTGRENIFLNGAILGMTRPEIQRKFDEIVAFAELEKFLDTPVKRYSSGMYMRLAFSVAAHLDPEILVVDEVLAVGDAAFQKKCLGRMRDISTEGRTVLFVSHNMAAIRSLCQRGVLLANGRKLFEGTAGECVDRYLAEITQHTTNEVDLSNLRRPLKPFELPLRMSKVRLASRDGRPLVRFGDTIEVELLFSVVEPLEEVVVGLNISSPDSVVLTECRTSQSYGAIEQLAPGEYSVKCRIEQNIFSPGLYFLNVGARCASKLLDYVPQAMTFEIYSDEAVASLWLNDLAGYVRIDSEWTQPEAVFEHEGALSS